MADMQCKVDIPNVAGLKDQELTVGREFYLSCTGEWPKNLAQDKLQLQIPEANKYQIKFLSFEFRSPDTADIKVTTYKAGAAQIKALKLSDGTQTIELGDIQYQVQSVIEKPKDPQAKVEAFGPVGPANIAVPMIYVFALGALILFFALLLGAKIFRATQRRRMLAGLKQHDSALAPLQQFHQSLRRLQRHNIIFFGGATTAAVAGSVDGDAASAFDELNTMFKVFLIRELHVPALDWHDKLILKDLRKYHKALYAEYAVDLKKLLREYSQGLKNKSSLNDKDILVLAEHSRKLAERMDRFKSAQSKSARGGR